MSDLIFWAGLAHFAVLVASALVPQVLDWKSDLARVAPLTRRLVWVHGWYIVGVIVFFGVLGSTMSGALAAGTPLARAICGFIALFWTARIALQYRVLYEKKLMRDARVRAGYHGLTCLFAFFVLVFGGAAL